MLVLALALCTYVTDKSFPLVEFLISNEASTEGIAAILFAVQAPPLAVLGYMFKVYSNDRKEKKDE